jgi:hypothetical protein
LDCLQTILQEYGIDLGNLQSRLRCSMGFFHELLDSV